MNLTKYNTRLTSLISLQISFWWELLRQTVVPGSIPIFPDDFNAVSRQFNAVSNVSLNPAFHWLLCISWRRRSTFDVSLRDGRVHIFAGNHRLAEDLDAQQIAAKPLLNLIGFSRWWLDATFTQFAVAEKGKYIVRNCELSYCSRRAISHVMFSCVERSSRLRSCSWDQYYVTFLRITKLHVFYNLNNLSKTVWLLACLWHSIYKPTLCSKRLTQVMYGCWLWQTAVMHNSICTKMHATV